MRLLTAKALVNKINDAEISVKSFRITEDTIYLDAFYQAVGSIESEMNLLNSLSIDSQDASNYNELDTLSALVDEKIVILNDLLFLQDGFRTEEALNKFSDAIVKSASHDPNQNDAQGDYATTSRFEWLFNRKNENTNERIIDTLRSLDEINREVEGIKFEEQKFEKFFRAKELELILKDQVLSKQIETYFQKLEDNELSKIAAEGEAAEAAITKTNKQIAIFCAVTGVLVLFMAFIIINYVRNNNQYRKALKLSKEEAENLAKLKQTFLDNVSHEIRTPMNAIAGFSEQIGQGPLTDLQRDQLAMVQKSTDHLIYLINDVLDLSKLQAAKITLEEIPFNPSELVNEVTRSFVNVMQTKNLEISTQALNNIPTILIGDPFRLKQILLNILSNAIKFTDHGGIYLSLKTKMNDNSTCILSIKIEDTGIGIEQSNLEKIFNEFEQAEVSTTRNYGGSGLGLSIVKQLIELHNGRLGIASKINEGTSITLEIPYKIGDEKSLAKEKVGQTYEPKDFKNLKVLIVDDERYNRLLIISILKKYNIKYTEAENGEEAILEVEKNDYDLILMDIRMPIIDGYQATKIIRNKKNSVKNKIPIIALTAAVSSQNIENYQKIGMNSVLAKPFKEKDLLEILGKHVKTETNKPAGLEQLPKENKSPIDLTSLKELSGADPAFYIDMLETFVSGTEEGLHEIDKYVQKEEWEMVAEYAHKISSPCNHLGAKLVYNLLKKIEHNGRQKTELDTVPILVDQMKSEADAVINAVQQEIKQVKKTTH